MGVHPNAYKYLPKQKESIFYLKKKFYQNNKWLISFFNFLS